MPNVSMSFISGSSNYRLSALKDHESSACHKCVITEKEHEEAIAVGKSLPARKIQQMSEKGHEILSKLHNISFHIMLQRLPFTAF